MGRNYRTPLIALCVPLIGALLFGFIYFGSKPSFLQSNRPGFWTPKSQPALGPLSYNFLARRPFENGTLIISDYSKSLSFAYDLETGRVLGQLTNAAPEFCFGNPPRLLCSQDAHPGPGANQLRERLQAFLFRISKGLINFPLRPARGTRYWLLGLKNHTAVEVGFIPATPNFTLVPSPDFHYCYTLRPPDFYLLNLEKPSIQKIAMPQWPCDWWDNTRVVLRETNHDITIFDVEKKTASLLVSASNITAFLKSHGVAIAPKHDQTFEASSQKISFAPSSDPFAIWNGDENDFYITDLHQRWLAEESFLLKVERPGGKLKLISPAFKFEWSDHFTPDWHFYVYTGRESGKASDGVFLRDLAAGTNRVLVVPAGTSYFSLPGFYKDSVIYLRSNVFWRISLDGSRNVRLFPPSETELSGPEGKN